MDKADIERRKEKIIKELGGRFYTVSVKAYAEQIIKAAGGCGNPQMIPDRLFSIHWRQVYRKHNWLEGFYRDRTVLDFLQMIKKTHKFHEDSRLRTGYTGRMDWTNEIEGYFSHLFERLETPWMIKEENSMFTIWHPKGWHDENGIWFRALRLDELRTAMLACLSETIRLGLRKKPWKLPFTWADCQSQYYGRCNNGSVWWHRRDYDIALLIANNILSTWDGYKKDWIPYDNQWCKFAHATMTITFSDVPIQQVKLNIRHNKWEFTRERSTRKWGFEDIVQFVYTHDLKAKQRAAWILATAFAVGGDRAARLINGFHEQHNLEKWWEKR
jgi:hypothetical protein